MNDLVNLQDGQPFTSSLAIADGSAVSLRNRHEEGPHAAFMSSVRRLHAGGSCRQASM